MNDNNKPKVRIVMCVILGTLFLFGFSILYTISGIYGYIAAKSPALHLLLFNPAYLITEKTTIDFYWKVKPNITTPWEIGSGPPPPKYNIERGLRIFNKEIFSL